MGPRRLVAVFALAVVAVVALSVPSPAGTKASGFRADRERYEIGRAITISFVNRLDHGVRMGKIWRIGASRTDQEVASYHWSDAQRNVAPDGQREWTWHQLGPACYGQCQNVWEGEQVDAGRYVVQATFDGKSRTDSFEIGSFFTLEFRDIEAEPFVVFAARQSKIDQMNEEARKPDDEKTLIVGGKVRRGQPYNGAWSYVMGSRSITMGEVWTEVCDAHPQYVEDNLSDWMGDMWCPWSSYIAHAGK